MQATYQDIPKGLLFMCGQSGYVFLKAGNGALQEYIEMDPTKKQMYIHSDGELQFHSQTNRKENIYGNLVHNVGQGFQMLLGQELSSIPSDFDQVKANMVGQGDFYISNAGTAGTGKGTIHVKGNFDIIVDEGDINVTTSQGKLNLTIQGDVDLSTQGNLNATVRGNSTVNTDGIVNISGEAVNISSTGGDVNYTSTGNLNVNGSGPVYVKSDSNIYLGNDGTDSVVRKSEYDSHRHLPGPPDRTGVPETPASVTQVRVS